jgi:hypothetical protein
MLILIFFDILVEISAEDPPKITKGVHFAQGRHFEDADINSSNSII